MVSHTMYKFGGVRSGSVSADRVHALPEHMMTLITTTYISMEYWATVKHGGMQTRTE
jgi:hypothetical protein